MGDNGTEAFGKPRHTRDGIVEGGKTDLTDAGTHIPLIVRRPGTIAPGTTTDDLIDMADWFPTFCDLANVTLPEDIQIDGTSFAGRLLENKPASRPWVTAGYKNKLSVFDGQTRVTTGDPVTKKNAALHEVLQSLPTGP
jgi:arylsulfatase A